MNEFFENNPITLRHCLLYHCLQWSSPSTAWIDFRETIGDKFIKEEEFHRWFWQFAEGIFDVNTEPIADMRDVFRNDKQALRACILYESLKYKKCEKLGRGRPYCSKSCWSPRKLFTCTMDVEMMYNQSYVMYENLRKTIGDDVISFGDFDFWFYRFLNGNCDLNYERDEDQKVYELMDMPIEVMRNIVKYLNIFDRLPLGRTSKSLLAFTESQKLFLSNLSLFIGHESVIIHFNSIDNITYRKMGTNGCVKDYGIFRRNLKKPVPNVPFLKEALRDFKSILKNPKLHLNQLYIDFEWSETANRVPIETVDEVIFELEAALNFTHQLQVKKFSFQAQSLDPILKILPFLKPRYLTTLSIISFKTKDDTMDRLIGTEQWKKAKSVNITCATISWRGSLHHLLHFEKFSIYYKEFTADDFREIKEFLVNSPNLISGQWESGEQIDTSAIKQEFGAVFQEKPHIHHYPIPNSSEYFEIKVLPRSIDILRKKA